MDHTTRLFATAHAVNVLKFYRKHHMKIIQIMTLAKSTPGTHVYAAEGTPTTNPKPAVTSIYVQKSAFTADPPLTLKLTLETEGL